MWRRAFVFHRLRPGKKGEELPSAAPSSPFLKPGQVYRGSSHRPDNRGKVSKGRGPSVLRTQPPTRFSQRPPAPRVCLGFSGYGATIGFITQHPRSTACDAHPILHLCSGGGSREPAGRERSPFPARFLYRLFSDWMQDKAEVSNTSEMVFTPVLVQTI